MSDAAVIYLDEDDPDPEVQNPDHLDTDGHLFGEQYELSTHLIADELRRRGYEPRWMRPAMFIADIDGVLHGWNMTRCNISSTIAAQITGSKRYTRQLLTEAGIAVARGGTYRDFDEALDVAQRIGWPVVVKPSGRGSSRGVTVGVRSGTEFETAWMATESGEVVVEQQVAGDEARFLTVAGRCVAVAGQRQPNVVGDGSSTIARLVTAKHAEREENPHLRGKRLELTDARLAYLANKGLSAESAPASGETVWLEDRGGIAGRPSIWRTGADSVDMTDTVHPSYLEIAERCERAIPGLGLCGVDMIAHDYTQPATLDNHIVVEVNSRPAIGVHHFPWDGQARDVASAIVDACIRRTRAS